MKKVFKILILFFLSGFAVSEISACTCVITPLSKRFKKAEAVFIGKIAEDVPENDSEIQNAKNGLPVLEVIKSWKGIRKDYVAVDFAEFPNSSGTCPVLYYFEEDQEYLIFAYGKDLKVEVQCSDTRPLRARYNETTEEISKLNSLWFRSWAKLNPF